MCLILLRYRMHPEYRLILAANRDEFYERPTLPLAAWESVPRVIAGRDVRGGGTWLGVTRNGRLAAVTNYRDPASQRSGAPSRGRLVSDFLTGDQPPRAYLKALEGVGRRYNGFNLLVGDAQALWYYSNRGNGLRRHAAGTYGLSNRLLDTNWPKVRKGREQLASVTGADDGWALEELFAILADRSKPPDAQLPDTGVGLDWERTLSSIFIASPDYGTRSSSVLLITHAGQVTFAERTFPTPQNGEGAPQTRRVDFTLP